VPDDHRWRRLHKTEPRDGSAGDTRNDAERDRDRILYTSAFRRLAGVTQVVGPLEGHIFHNRLTHSLEVAQVARRLAEGVVRQNRALVGRIDADVAEAAGLAHDLGHPPFGHVAEDELNECVTENGVPDGFEGNAQSFRIVTKLAAHRRDYVGLDLTRTTLNAILKYPWLKGEGDPEKPKKFGAYRAEREDLAFAREGMPPRVQSIEAAIMDHADAIAYSVHDLEDFYRAGLVPLEELQSDSEYHIEVFRKSKKVDEDAIVEHTGALRNLIELLPTTARYGATYDERTTLRTTSSRLINDFVKAVHVEDTDGSLRLIVPVETEVKMRFLQSLVWANVIDSPRLATQQHGQRAIVRTLFEAYLQSIRRKEGKLVPPSFQQEFELAKEGDDRYAREVRLAADIVASFGDRQATLLFRRLTGHVPGSVMDMLEG
jgi:dGTPase